MKNQKPTFVYSNLYHLYKKNENSKPKSVLSLPAIERVEPADINPVEFIQKRAKPFIQKRVKPTSKDALTDLHKRLQFMLKELDTIIDGGTDGNNQSA